MKNKKTKSLDILTEDKELGELLNPRKEYIRSPKLDLKKKVYITEEAYDILRSEKLKQGRSMAQIVCDLILKGHEEDNL